MAIDDTMQSLKYPVGTHCVGYAYNLAGFLLAAEKRAIDLQCLLRGLDCNLQVELHVDRLKISVMNADDYLFKEVTGKTNQPVEKHRETPLYGVVIGDPIPRGKSLLKDHGRNPKTYFWIIPSKHKSFKVYMLPFGTRICPPKIANEDKVVHRIREFHSPSFQPEMLWIWINEIVIWFIIPAIRSSHSDHTNNALVQIGPAAIPAKTI